MAYAAVGTSTAEVEVNGDSEVLGRTFFAASEWADQRSAAMA